MKERAVSGRVILTDSVPSKMHPSRTQGCSWMKSKRTRLRTLRTSQKILQCPQIENPGVTAMALLSE